MIIATGEINTLRIAHYALLERTHYTYTQMHDDDDGDGDDKNN